jgi:hypothetical protein
MTDRVSSRHEDDLGGRFLPFSNTRQVDVTVEVATATASLAKTQHTAWMLVNLLARLDGVVRRIGLVCPPGIALAGRIVPLSPRDVDLRTALLLGAQAVDAVPIEPDARLDRTLLVGNSTDCQADLYLHGEGWWGGISEKPIADLQSLHGSSALPFGPYVAACLAAAEVFKAARLRPGAYRSPGAAFYSLWDHRPSGSPAPGGPSVVDLEIDAALAGVGAVGSAALHCLWACPSLAGRLVVADNDSKGVDRTNLNRSVLFGRAAIGALKATAAAQVAGDSGIELQPFDHDIVSLNELPPRVLSAVDTNTARAGLQNRYPARILSASTLDLRAEALRCGPPGVGACLRCHNPPVVLASDADLRMRLRGAASEEVDECARRVEVTSAQAREWIETGRCGIPGERLLAILRYSENEGQFAVGFVSVMAGTMLAAELLKDYMTDPGPLSESVQRAVFQFHNPGANSNRAAAYSRDPTCPMCVPQSVACRLWAQRYAALSPKRSRSG